ncbi:branched-chain amino acid transport system permease protein [Tistlia consotensis]|uniref:Branched-chain amino acid transport system permease protein n=1 Tax=Tistlia consotensis USBA 355 TaxID=560819 RepID=A0A1Y6CE31_9PROT|nr:branched-chain amino acid ABC transporter permease [Tistlia consotensis]SMF51462.1 branched-chain amino acid transport system permease protein [Tistlia consotensis USBA 355]SNR84263.1 branched-chain amino acid transport system permease protein [Tistlia consotensis]
MGFSLFANLAFNGLITGLVVSLLALSITLVFGIARFPNAAAGDVATVGAFAGLLGPLAGGGTLWIILCGMAAGALLSVAFYFLLFRPLAGKSAVSSLIASIGMAFFVRAALTFFLGHDQRVYPLPIVRAMPVGPLRVQPTDIEIVVAAVLALAAVFSILHLTPIGKRMRAVADNAELARVSGIRANRVLVAMWLIAGLLAGLSGTLLGVKTVVSPEMGWDLLMPAFAATILGTIGNPVGAVLGGVLIGLAQELSTPFVGFTYKLGVGFLVLLVTLLIRPQGLFAKNSLVR